MTLKQEEENTFENKGLFSSMGSTGVRDGDNCASEMMLFLEARCQDEVNFPSPWAKCFISEDRYCYLRFTGGETEGCRSEMLFFWFPNWQWQSSEQLP